MGGGSPVPCHSCQVIYATGGRLRGASWGVAGVGHWGPPTAAAWGGSSPGSCLHAAAAPSPAGAGAGASGLGRARPPPRSCLEEGGGGQVGAALPESQWWAPGMSSPAPSSSPCASRAPRGWDSPPRWPEQQRWPLAERPALGSASCGPCPSLPAGISQAGTATRWWGIKGRKGRRKKNTPWHHQLTELAPGWGRVGTAAGLVCQPGTGQGCGKGSPFSCPGDPPLWPRETCRGNCHPLLSTRGATSTPLLVPRLMRIPFLLRSTTSCRAGPR